MIPPELYDEIKRENCIIFAGAGISTEGGVYGGHFTFYDSIKKECNYPTSQEDPSFPDVMQNFCKRKDGRKKNLLTRKIIDRIESFSQKGEINTFTTFFHREVTLNPFFRIIVTTNWDTFFERSLNILVPMVEDRDIPFWDDRKRQILKIHGCVTRPYTIVVTKDDYNNLIKNKNNILIFTKLKDLMATKTFIFVGYSMQDPNIKIIYCDLLKSMGEFSRLSYAVDPNPKKETINEWKKQNVRIIKEDGFGFLREINDRLVNEKIIPDPELVHYFTDQFNQISKIHGFYSQNQLKNLTSLRYQDGLLFELNYVLSNSKYGIKIADLKDRLNKKTRILKKYQKENHFIEIPFWTGSVEILKRFLMGKKEPIPFDFFNKEKKK